MNMCEFIFQLYFFPFHFSIFTFIELFFLRERRKFLTGRDF